MPDNEPVSRWHIEAYDPDIDDPPTPAEHDCIGEHDAADVPVDLNLESDADLNADPDADGNGGGDGA